MTATALVAPARRLRLLESWGPFEKGAILTDSREAADAKDSGLAWVDSPRFDALARRHGIAEVLEPDVDILLRSPDPATWTLASTPAHYLERFPEGPNAPLAQALIDAWALKTEPTADLHRSPDGPNAPLARVLVHGGAGEMTGGASLPPPSAPEEA